MSSIIGVVVLARHGDRMEMYQDPMTQKASRTKLTPLGETESVQLGTFLRKEYFSSDSPSFVKGISSTLVDDRQIEVFADNGGSGNVILDSATALLQGLFPPTSQSKSVLANGTTVMGPFGGYQFVPIKSVEPEQSIQLEGWTDCPAFDAHVKEFYSSAEFKTKAQEAAPFLSEVKPFLFGRPNTLENAMNIFDYLNVNYIHNETYAYRLPPSYLGQARDLANYHEHGIYSDKTADGIGNVAARTILPSIIDSLERISNAQEPLQFVLQEVSYKPFISLFNVTEIDSNYPDLNGIPGYASALAFELRKNEDGETILRTKFKNGTADDSFRVLHLFDHKDDMPLNEFVYRLDLSALQTVPEWCKACGQRTARGCNLCSADLTPSNGYQLPSIGCSGSKTCTGLIGAQDISFLAIFAFIFVAFFGVYKFFASKSSKPKLPGYDVLPTAVEYYDETPVLQKVRFQEKN